MRDKLEFLQILLNEGDDETFRAEVELWCPRPNEIQLACFEQKFPEVVKAIKEILRIGFIV